MEGLQCCGSARGCARDLPDIQFQKQATRINGLSVSEEQNSEITILTDEGDRVMLSNRQRSEAALLTYEHLSWTPHESLQEGMQLSAAESEGEVAFAVDGELNDQEMADIQALLKELGGMLKAFLTAEDESEASPLAAGELERFETISAFKADFEYRVRGSAGQLWHCPNGGRRRDGEGGRSGAARHAVQSGQGRLCHVRTDGRGDGRHHCLPRSHWPL